MGRFSQFYNRSSALRLSVEVLTQQFEELKQLREKIRRVEAKAKHVSPSECSRWRRQRSRSGPLRRDGRCVR
jgi:hypothetical protein